MRREDDTRQAQTQTDAADTSECLYCIFHPRCHVSSGVVSQTRLSRRGRLERARTLVVCFHSSVWVGLSAACVREGGFKSATLQLRGLHQAVDGAFDARLSEQKGASDWRGCVCVFMCVSINLSPRATYQPLPCQPNLEQPPP